MYHSSEKPNDPAPTFRIATVGLGHFWLQNMFRSAQKTLLQEPGVEVADFHILKELSLMREWGPDAILAHLHNVNAFRKIHENFSVPVVNTAALPILLPYTTVTPDNAAIGALAADFLLNRGYSSFAFIGNQHDHSSAERYGGFRSAIPKAITIHTFEKKLPLHSDLERNILSPESEQFTAWLSWLPQHTGLFVASSQQGAISIRCMKQAKLDIFSRFGIISGHDMDRPIVPTLTSIDVNESSWGREAAKLMLQQLMDDAAPRNDLRIPPVGIHERETTSAYATDDPVIRKATRFIHQNAAGNISVMDVVNAADVSRRTLETRYKQALGKTLMQGILEAHIAAAKRLLLETDLTVYQISEQIGFSDVNRLIRQFKHAEGMTPGAFRKQLRQDS